MRPYDSSLLGDKEAPAFHSDYSFFLAGIWREWVQVHEWHPRGRRKKTFHPFVLITIVSLFLDLYSSPSNACYTDISNLGIHVFWVSHPCTQITATGRGTKTLIMHLNKQTDHDNLLVWSFEAELSSIMEHSCWSNLFSPLLPFSLYKYVQ